MSRSEPSLRGARRVQRKRIKRAAERRAPRRQPPTKQTIPVLDAPRRTDLQELLASRAEHRVSVYMPVHAPGTEGEQNPIRLKNLLSLAEELLVGKGMRAADARTLLKRARALLGDKAFWEQHEGGLCLLLTSDACHAFRLDFRVEESLTVGHRFRVWPLLPVLCDEQFWLLAVSANHVRLYRGDHEKLAPVAVRTLPENMAEALNYDVSRTGGQLHSATPQRRGKQSAGFHGQGGKIDAHKDDLKQYCRRIDEVVQRVLQAEESPLLLACVDYLFPIYREVNHYAHLVERPLAGNVDYSTPHQLHERAWSLVKPFVGRPQREAVARYRELLSGTSKVSPHLTEIIPTALEGRVDTLFLARDGQQWGTFDTERRVVQLHAKRQAKDEDLLDMAAVETLAHGGTVYLLPSGQLPEGGTAAAIYRYQL